MDEICEHQKENSENSRKDLHPETIVFTGLTGWMALKLLTPGTPARSPLAMMALFPHQVLYTIQFSGLP